MRVANMWWWYMFSGVGVSSGGETTRRVSFLGWYCCYILDLDGENWCCTS